VLINKRVLISKLPKVRMEGMARRSRVISQEKQWRVLERKGRATVVNSTWAIEKVPSSKLVYCSSDINFKNNF
jgi:hypothetical protein